MPRRQTDRATIKNKTIECMKTLGVYRPEYDRVIDVYAGIIEQYEKLKKSVDTEAMQVRAPAVITLEKLRADIAKYSDLLCLNPKAFEKADVKPKPKETALEAALRKLGGA